MFCVRKDHLKSTYFIFISVLPEEEDLSLTGISDDYVTVDTVLDLTCTISRIRPEAADMFGWLVKTGKTDPWNLIPMLTGHSINQIYSHTSKTSVYIISNPDNRNKGFQNVSM